MLFFCLLFLSLLTTSQQTQEILVFPDSNGISSWKMSPILESLGIEYLNHEIYGNGLHAQMIFGESFEEPEGVITSSLPQLSLQSSGNNNLYFRHCDFDGYLTNLNIGPTDDFIYYIHQPGLNGEANTISFESTNYDTMFISLKYDGSLEPTRLGLVTYNNTQEFNDSSTFKIVKALNNDSNSISLQAYGKYSGYYIGINNELKGDCESDYSSPESDVVLLDINNVSNANYASWLLSSNVIPDSENGYISCGGGRTSNSDLVKGISNMWMSESLSNYSSSLQINYALLNNTQAFNGLKYQNIHINVLSQLDNNIDVPTLGNYGLNCQLGMNFIAGETYTGHVYIRAPEALNYKPLSITFKIEDDVTKNVLDEYMIIVNTYTDWIRYDFVFTAKYNTTCNTNEYGQYSCSGKFVVYVTVTTDFKAGTYVSFDIDYVYMTPTAWGLLDNSTISGKLGLPARRDIALALKNEGLKVLRMGGSMCNTPYYRWKNFTGDRDLRQPYPGIWYRQPGNTQSRGFGMFEIIDLCNIIGCEPLITINNNERPGDMADFVEYCYGNVSTTQGNNRINDDHRPFYNVKWIEIGNEQGLTQQLLDQIINITQAMDAKSMEIGAPLFNYAIGHNLNTQELSDSLTTTYIKSLKYLGDRIFWDLHVGADPSSVAYWEDMVTQFESLVKSLNSSMRFVILEENGGDHGLLRGLGHATYNNMFIRHGNFGYIHGYANAIEAWQGMDSENAFPQGQLFYLPNMTFGQPTYYVNEILDMTFQNYSMNLIINSTNTISNFDGAALIDNYQSTISIYIINWNTFDVNVIIKNDISNNLKFNTQYETITIKGITGADNEENTPSQPNKIIPQYGSGTIGMNYTVVSNSFVTFIVKVTQ